MKRKLIPKALFAVVAAGGVILGGVTMMGCRESSATAVDTAATSADGAVPAAPQTRHEQAKAMAAEMRSHARGAQHER